MTNRILIGNFPGGGSGLRVSKSGYDVASNPVDNDQLIFNSDWISLLPIHQIGTFVVNPNTSQTITFEELPYPPMIMMYAFSSQALGLTDPAPSTMMMMINDVLPYFNDSGAPGTTGHNSFYVQSFVDKLTVSSGSSNPARQLYYCVLKVPMR